MAKEDVCVTAVRTWVWIVLVYGCEKCTLGKTSMDSIGVSIEWED